MKQSDADEEGKRVRDLKKGWKAWELLKQQGDALMLDADLLLVHAVGDKTALTMYAPNVRKFLAFAEQHSCPMSTRHSRTRGTPLSVPCARHPSGARTQQGRSGMCGRHGHCGAPRAARMVRRAPF